MHKKTVKPAAEWQAIIDKWRASNLPARAWCRQNSIIYTTFMGWRSRLQKNKHPTSAILSASSFVEIVEAPQKNNSIPSSGVVIECHGMHIYLAKGFDSSVLKGCIKALREELCYR